MQIEYNQNFVCEQQRRGYQIKKLQERVFPPAKPKLPYTKLIDSDLERYLIGSQYFVSQGKKEGEQIPSGMLYFYDPAGQPLPARTIHVPVKKEKSTGVTVIKGYIVDVYINPIPYTPGSEPPEQITAEIRVQGRKAAPDEPGDSAKPPKITLNYVYGGNDIWKVVDMEDEIKALPAELQRTGITKTNLEKYLNKHSGKIPLVFYWNLLKSSVISAIQE